MKISVVETGMTARGWRFLLAPEDSSEAPPGAFRRYERTAWNSVKTLLWYALSILAALLIGQL